MPSILMEIDTSVYLHGSDGLPAGCSYSVSDDHTITALSCMSERSTGDLTLNIVKGDKLNGIFGNNLTFALQADKPITLGSPSNGGAVSSWLNSIKPSEEATQGTSSHQPLWSSSNFVQFGSGTPGDHLDLPATPFDFGATEEFTIFVVLGLITANSDDEAFILGGTDSIGTSPVSYYGIENNRRIICDNDQNQFVSTSNVPASGEFRCLSRRSSGNLDEYVNGTQTLTNDATCDAEFKFSYINNALHRSGEQGGGSQRIQEILVYSDSVATMGSDEREEIEGYLAHKYSMTSGLPTGHPYKTSDPRGTDYDTNVLTADLTLSAAAKGKYNPASTPSFGNGTGTSPSDWATTTSVDATEGSVSAGDAVRIYPVDYEDVDKLLIKVDYTVD